MPEEARGIPNRSDYGDVSKLPLRTLLTYVDQLHEARRAGTHHDIRFGDRELFSWAGRNGLPLPSEKRTLFQQPLHSKEYADFQGEISEGYGAGKVRTHDRGSVFVTEANPDKIKFVLAHKKHPEYYTMLRTQGENKPWLIVNHTPTDPAKVVGSSEIFKKKHLGVIPAGRVSEIMHDVVEGKIDGASGLFKLKDSSIDVMSFRVGSGGRPIMHTERFFENQENRFDLPKEFRNRVARGEIYGVDALGKPVGAQATSPLLNMSLENSLNAQKERGIKLRAALFGFADRPLNYPEREKELTKLLSHLPEDKFVRPPVAHTPEEAQKLWNEIAAGEHPETDEGVVAYPKEGNPVKVKLRPEYDVPITDVFPGEGKYKGSAGGIVYGEGGRVGTGFDDQYRQWLWDNRDAIKGRIAKITATKKLPSGKYFQPSFVGLHEDYPTKQGELNFAPDYTPAQLKEMGAYHEVYGPKGTPRLASLSKWPEHWYHKEDPWGWLQWYARYSGGRRMEDDTRQIKRWRAFKARHGGRAFQENPTPRRAYALRNWGIDPVKLLNDEKKQVKLIEAMDKYRSKKYEKVGECVDYLAYLQKVADSPAWQRGEGKNPEGGLNAAGRTSYNRETGGNLKAPVTEKKPTGERAKRQNSFCARMCGHKRKNTGAATKNDPDSRVNKALRKWRCKCGEEAQQKKVKKEKEHPIGRAILANALGGTAMLPPALAGAQLAMRMPSTGGEALAKEKLQHILQNSKIPKHLQPKIDFSGTPSFYDLFTGGNPLLKKLTTNAMYDSARNAVSTTGEGQLHPGILAHELGHAQIHHGGSRLAKMLQSGGRAFSGGLGPLGSLMATQLLVDADDTNLQGAGKGAIAGLTAGAPMLLNEADASRRGIGMLLRSNLGAKQKLMGSLSMLPAFATYAGTAAGVPALFGSLTARAKRRVKEKNKALETNSTKAEAEKTAGNWLKYQAKLASTDMEWSRAGGGIPEMAGAVDALKNQIPKMQQAAYNFGGKAYDFLAGLKKPQTGATPIKPVVAGGQIR